MGAIQGSINGMIGAAAIGIGAAKKLDSSIKKDQAITKESEAAEKQALSQEALNQQRLAQFIREAKAGGARGDAALAEMQQRQGLTEEAVKMVEKEIDEGVLRAAKLI